MSYYTFDEIGAAVVQLGEHYTSHAELLQLPHASIEGRKLQALVIGDKRGQDRPSAILVGGIHAREWVPPDALVSLAADLLEAASLGTGLGYGGAHFDKATISRVMSELQLVILPCANPDGRVFSQEVDPDWRKNRSRNVGPANTACFGVDINRNFDVCWDFKKCFAPGFVSASDDPCHKYLYVGPGAASEPETRNIVWLLDHFDKAGWFIDIHSYVPAVFHGWGIDENQTVDVQQSFLNPAFDGKRGIESDTLYREFIEARDLAEVQRLAHLMGDTINLVHGDSYAVQAAFSLYATSGASDDYAYSRHRANPAKGRVLGFTMECGRDFQPELADRENVMREVSAAMVAFAAGLDVGAVS